LLTPESRSAAFAALAATTAFTALAAASTYAVGTEAVRSRMGAADSLDTDTLRRNRRLAPLFLLLWGVPAVAALERSLGVRGCLSYCRGRARAAQPEAPRRWWATPSAAVVSGALLLAGVAFGAINLCAQGLTLLLCSSRRQGRSSRSAPRRSAGPARRPPRWPA
jgi:hypothetical protein